MVSILDFFRGNEWRAAPQMTELANKRRHDVGRLSQATPPGHAHPAPLFLAPELNSLITERPPAGPGAGVPGSQARQEIGLIRKWGPMRSQSVAERFLSTLPGSDRFGDG